MAFSSSHNKDIPPSCDVRYLSCGSVGAPIRYPLFGNFSRWRLLLFPRLNSDSGTVRSEVGSHVYSYNVTGSLIDVLQPNISDHQS